MSIASYFSDTYLEARENVLSACADRSLEVDSRHNPKAKGAKGEDLYTDIIHLGPLEASKTLLLLSATHGVEGYCGSGVQTGLLQEGYFQSLQNDLNVIMVHAMNPYGFSHDRRVNEDNVDLNRNFLDFEQAGRPQSDYAKIHEHLLPDDWDGPSRLRADEKLADFIQNNGMKAFQAAVSSGQYTYPDGIFYGGAEQTWSNTMFRSVLSDYLTKSDIVGIIDFHTGLGPHGYGELITIGSDKQKQLAAQWYGNEVTDPEAGTSTSAPLDGMVAHGISETLPKAELAFITIEFGTHDLTSVLTALRADNWLYEKGDLSSPLGARIKRDIKEAFYPDSPDWKQSVWTRSCDVVQLALDGIGRM